LIEEVYRISPSWPLSVKLFAQKDSSQPFSRITWRWKNPRDIWVRRSNLEGYPVRVSTQLYQFWQIKVRL